MLTSIFETHALIFLTFSVLGSIILLHFFLFREYSRQEKIQLKRLEDMERLVHAELIRSQAMSFQNEKLDQIKTKTKQQLEVFKLQVKAWKTQEDSKGNPDKTG